MERVEKYKVYCNNCGFGTDFTQDEFDGLDKSSWIDVEEHNEIDCPVCNQELEVTKL